MISYRYYLCLLLAVPQAGFSLEPWRCTLHDCANGAWSVQSHYQRTAVQGVLDRCRKESTVPASCKKTNVRCDGFSPKGPRQHSRHSRGSWSCTALDSVAAAWHSRHAKTPDAAAFGAKARCKKGSSLPETCYVNFITCLATRNHW